MDVPHSEHQRSDNIAWGVFQEVRGAWERIPAATRDALHPAMRSALALRILAVRRAETACGGTVSLPTQLEIKQRTNDTICQAADALGSLELDDSETGGVLGLLDALHVLISTLPLSGNSNCAVQCNWLQQLVNICPITQASVAEAETAINHVTMTDKLGASSPLRRALAVSLVAALSRRLNSQGPNCWRQLSIISKNLSGALQASRTASFCCAGSSASGTGLGGVARNPIHLPTTTSARQTGKSVLGAGLIRAIEAGGVGDDDDARVELCRLVCVSSLSQMLLYWAPILSKQLLTSALASEVPTPQHNFRSDHATLESAFLATGLRSLLEELSVRTPGLSTLESERSRDLNPDSPCWPDRNCRNDVECCSNWQVCTMIFFRVYSLLSMDKWK